MALSISKGLAAAGGTSRGQEIIPDWVRPRLRLQWVGDVERPPRKEDVSLHTRLGSRALREGQDSFQVLP